MRLLRLRLHRHGGVQLLATAVILLVFLGSLWIIARELQGFAYAEMWAYLRTLPLSYVLLAGLISHIPGWLGVFESVMLLLLTPEVSPPTILGALLAYRAIFPLLPLVLAALVFGTYDTSAGPPRRVGAPQG